MELSPIRLAPPAPAGAAEPTYAVLKKNSRKRRNSTSSSSDSRNSNDDEEEELRAPLASMEDISLLASTVATPASTPGPTPGASPRSSRARWGGGPRSSAPVETIPEEEPEFPPPVPMPPMAVPSARRFESPARRNNLLRESLISRPYAAPGPQPVTSTPRRLNPCSTEDNTPEEEEEVVNGQVGDGRQEEESTILLPRSLSLQQPHVEFLTPRKSQGLRVPARSNLGSCRVFAEEGVESNVLDQEPPKDRYRVYLQMKVFQEDQQTRLFPNSQQLSFSALHY